MCELKNQRVSSNKELKELRVFLKEYLPIEIKYERRNVKMKWKN
jgi:hypothetical protein